MSLDWMGFRSVRNMTDDERDANDERVRLAADRVRMVTAPWRCCDCGRRAVRCHADCQVIVESEDV